MAVFRKALICGVIGAGCGLAGCSSMDDALGLGKSPPDEFAVMRQAPLIVPPEFNLRPPKPGAPRPNEIPAVDQARIALLGGIPPTETKTSGEEALLVALDANGDNSDIRTTLREDALARSDNEEPGFFTRIFTWGDEEGNEDRPKTEPATAPKTDPAPELRPGNDSQTKSGDEESENDGEDSD